MGKKTFEIVEEDKEHFIQALSYILDAGGTNEEEKKFLKNIKSLMDLQSMKLTKYEDKESIWEEIKQIKNEDLVKYFFAIAKELKDKQEDKEGYKKALDYVENKYNPKPKDPKNISVDSSNNIKETVDNMKETVDNVKDIVDNVKDKAKTLFSKFTGR